MPLAQHYTPQATIDWLTDGENPAVTVLTCLGLLAEAPSPPLDSLWARRNEYEPVARILEQMLPDGSWSCMNRRPAGSVPCLTANVGRALALRDKRVYHSLPGASREFQDTYWSAPAAARDGIRERFVAEHAPFTYGPKPGWVRFGYPLSYNSDALEALAALALHDEPARQEYADAIAVVRSAADAEDRWTLRTSFNGGCSPTWNARASRADGSPGGHSPCSITSEARDDRPCVLQPARRATAVGQCSTCCSAASRR